MDPTGTSCVGASKDAKCTIDQFNGKELDRGKLSKATLAKIERLEKNLTKAYVKLLEKGDKEVTVKGNATLGVGDAKVKASRVTMEMQDRKLSVRNIEMKDPGGGSIRAEARDDALTFYKTSLDTPMGAAGDYAQMDDGVHESMHYLPQLGGWRTYRYEHQEPFDDAVKELLQ